MIVLFIMMSKVSKFSICHTQKFYLVQIVFILLVSIFVNIYFLYSVFNDIFYLNNITTIFDTNLYITGLFNRDNKFFYFNCKVTGENITLFQQGNKFKIHKFFITSENASFFFF